MVNKLLFLTFVLFSLTLHSVISHSEEVEEPNEAQIECTYSFPYFPYYDFTFSCTLKNDPKIIKADITITEVVNAKERGKSKDDVKIFYVAAKVFRYIPKNLDVLFPELFGMRFDNTQLQVVTKEDLQPFPELLMFVSYRNPIKYLEKDLFKYNTKLEYVNFRLNSITYIEPTIFDSLSSNLQHLWLDGTAIACGLVGAATNKDAKTQIGVLKKSACAKIESAPAEYTLILKIQEEKALCDARVVDVENQYKDILDCYMASPPRNCSVLSLPRSYLVRSGKVDA